jgi:hemolysin activation/secretion protein
VTRGDNRLAFPVPYMTKRQLNRADLWSLALVVIAPAAMAQQPPSAGSQIQQIPAAPVPPRPAPDIRIEPRSTAPAGPLAAPESVKITVRSLRVTGASLYSESELIALTGFKPGSQLSLADLQAMAGRITAHYQARGYFVAQAFLPAQEIRDEAVTIAVSEGRLGRVALQNQSRLKDSVARASLDGLNSGDVIALQPVESRLLLLSDLPGVNVKSTLVPGAAPGTSDLLIDMTPGPLVSGSVDADNAGNRYTGRYRVGATVNLNNPFGLGDVASLRGLTSGEGLKYLRGSYQLQLGLAQAGVAYSRLDYVLGREFDGLGANGTAEIASVFGRYPLIRSRDNNLSFVLGYDAKTFEDRVDAIPVVTDKKSRVLTAGINGDRRDTLGGGGFTSYSASIAAGKLNIRTPAALAADAVSARTNGSFNKLSYSVARLQNLGGPFSVQAGISGQFASKNLDVSEKMELGGMNAVRAYPEGEAYADEGHVATVEGRMDLPKFSAGMPGYMQLVAFVDAGTVTLDKNPWAPGDNHRHLSGAGVGVNWGDPGNFLVRAYYARKLGHAAAISSPDRSGRFWLQMVKYF